MAQYFASPRSPMTDTPVCDSDEEVFFGPVTSKELEKASQLKRRTQYFFPSFDWKPRVSPLAQKNEESVEDKVDDTEVVGSVSTGEPNMSVSADSLESQSYITSSERPVDSSKGDYWSALSEQSSTTNSHASLNNAAMSSKFSEDSLESDETQDATKKVEDLASTFIAPISAPSLYSNISEDSLDDTSKQQMNVAAIHSETYDHELSGNSEPQSTGLSALSDTSSSVFESRSLNVAKLANETYSASENSCSKDMEQCSTALQGSSEGFQPNSNETFARDDAGPLTATYELLVGADENDTYTVGNDSCKTIDLDEPDDANTDLPEQVPVDRDGGFLSILSEAALYHASQLKENAVAEMEDTTSTTKSLEDRFKVFGIDADELEDQQLSSSIMYVTGRESHFPCREAESNTFYTGRSSGCRSSIKSCSEHNNQTAMGDLADTSAVSSQEQSEECSQVETVNATSESQESASDCMQYSSELNRCIENGTLGSAASTYQDSADENKIYQERTSVESMNENEALDQSNSYVRESSGISGVYELNSVSENECGSFSQSHPDEEPLHNDSNASSYTGEMNDTLEEYEMMMRYGVDYILGRKGHRKRSDHGTYREENEGTEKRQELHQGSPMPKNADHQPSGHSSTSSFPSHQQNSSTSSIEYLDAVSNLPSSRKIASPQVRDHKVLSPLHKHVLKCTPQKSACASKASGLKVPSKVPRVASVTPSKMLHTSPHKTRALSQPVTPTSSSKVPLRPVTPSSESKIGMFKKPVTPAVSGSRIPKTVAPSPHGLKSNSKILEKIQSPVGAYIHNTPSPVLVTNVKAKSSDRAPYEKEMHARAMWRAGEIKFPPKAGGVQVNAENMNPNIGCGLPAVKYTKAPCIKLDETTKLPVPRGEKIMKLLDAPSPQVIKHEGRLRVNCGSPQLAAKMQSMADSMDDSILDVHSVSGDISLCVSKQATRTDTLSHMQGRNN